MFKRIHVLENGKNLEIIRCGQNEIPYIKSLKNIMDKEVQRLAHVGTYQTTKVYLFERLMAEEATEDAHTDDPHTEGAHMKMAYTNIPAERVLTSSTSIFLLAVIDNEIVGYIHSMSLHRNDEDLPARKNLLLCDVEVIRKYRRLGIASLLFEALKACGTENGYEYLYSDSTTNSSAESEDLSPGINLFFKTGATELINMDAMQAVLFGEETGYDDINNEWDEEEVKTYKWNLQIFSTT